MAAQFQVFLFGCLQAVYEGKQLQLKFPPKTIPLWAYLLLHSDQMISRQWLAFALWPDAPEERALANLRRHLYQLKQALPSPRAASPWLLIDVKTVQWNLAAACWLDVAEFERLSREASTVEEAITYYRDDLLADCYDDLIIPERERLRILYMADLSHLIGHYRSQRRFPQAIASASRLLTIDPLSEDTVRLLMALHHEAGDRASALQEYASFRRRLQEELAVEPMPETQALAEAIRRQRMVLGPEKEGIADDSVRKIGQRADRPSRRQVLALPFVGRSVELEQLGRRWGQATRGAGSLVMVGGEAGVGKTRLVEEFAHRAEAEGGRVLVGHALASGETPYRPLANALRPALPLIAALDLPPFWLAVVAQLLPELHARRGGQTPLPGLPALDPEQERLRLFEGLFRCLVGLSRPRPVVLILEDLHWAGAGMADLLAFIGCRVGSHPLLVVGAYRPEYLTVDHPLATARRTLQRDGFWHAMALGPLSSEAIQQLIEGLAGPTLEAADLAARLFEVSEGHPLFLQELLQDLMAKGLLRLQEGRWQVQPVGDLAVAPGVRQAISARLARLSAPARTLVEIAAVLGQAFPFDMLHQASGWSEYAVLDSLDELLDELVIREAGQGGAFDYAFSHHLVQTVVYEASSPAQRQRRHRRIAGLLAVRKGTSAEIAHHYDLGGEPEQAAAFYLQTAHRALVLRADDEALSALARGLVLTQTDELRWQILCEQEDIFHRRGERSQQAVCLTELAALAERLEDEEERQYQVLRRRIYYHRALGERQMESDVVRDLAQRAAANGDLYWQAEAHLAEAGYLSLTGHFGAAIASLQQALPLYEVLANARGLVACHCLWAEMAVHLSRSNEAQAHLQAAYALTRTHGDQGLLLRALRATATAAFVHQDYAESRALAERLLALSQEIGDRAGEADAHARLATIATRRFRVGEARQHYRGAAELYGLADNRQGQAAVHLNVGILVVNLGHYEDGIASFRLAETIFHALDDPRGLAVCALNQSAAAIYLGNWALARETAQRACDLSHRLGMVFIEANALGNLGEVALNLGELPQAEGYLRRSLALRRQADMGPGDNVTDLSLLALTLHRLGDEVAARQAVDAVIALCESTLETIPYPQQALWVAARIYRGLGEARRAAKLLAWAYAILQEKAAAIPDLESRNAFLQIPYNRELQQAWKVDIWPDSTVV